MTFSKENEKHQQIFKWPEMDNFGEEGEALSPIVIRFYIFFITAREDIEAGKLNFAVEFVEKAITCTAVKNSYHLE